MIRIINGKRYDTEVADVVSTDKYWDGNNWDRGGRNKTLYRTKKGNFFTFRETRWQGEKSYLTAVSKDEAMVIYDELPEQIMDYKEAFGIDPEEA